MKKVLIGFILLFILLLLGFLIYTHFIFKDSIPILAYHDVIESPSEMTDVSIKNFEDQMKYLKKMNYKTLSLDEFYDFKNGKKISGKKVLLTFDDGRESFYTNVLPILEKYGFKAVNFVIGYNTNYETYMSSEQIEDIYKNHPNFKIESHSYNLHNETSARSDDYHLYNADMEYNKKYNFQYYAYPFGIQSSNYKQALKDNQYKMAFVFSPSKWATKEQDNYEITRVPIYKDNSLFKFILKVSLKL